MESIFCSIRVSFCFCFFFLNLALIKLPDFHILQNIQLQMCGFRLNSICFDTRDKVCQNKYMFYRNVCFRQNTAPAIKYYHCIKADTVN